MDKPSLKPMEPDWTSLYRVGGTAALLQLAAVLVAILAAAVLGARPASVEEFYRMYQAGKLAGVLQDDFTSLVMIAMYLGTFPALYVALRPVNPVYPALAALATSVAVATCFSIHPGFSLMYLSDLYAAAASDVQRAQLLAAGEAILAADLWHSTGGYMAGILLQGAGIVISLVMLRSPDFSKLTAWSGLLANSLDLAQHLLHPFAPGLSATLMMFMGPFYLVWFPMLARDLFRLARKQPSQASTSQGYAAA